MVTQLEHHVREVLTRREGRVAVAEFQMQWLSEFGTVLDFAANGVENIQQFIDLCSTVCW